MVSGPRGPGGPSPDPHIPPPGGPDSGRGAKFPHPAAGSPDADRARPPGDANKAARLHEEARLARLEDAARHELIGLLQLVLKQAVLDYLPEDMADMQDAALKHAARLKNSEGPALGAANDAADVFIQTLDISLSHGFLLAVEEKHRVNANTWGGAAALADGAKLAKIGANRRRETAVKVAQMRSEKAPQREIELFKIRQHAVTLRDKVSAALLDIFF